MEGQLVQRRPRICVAQAQAANPLYLSYRTGFEVFEPIAARKTLASAIQIGNPVSYKKAIDALRRYDGVVEQALILPSLDVDGAELPEMLSGELRVEQAIAADPQPCHEMDQRHL